MVIEKFYLTVSETAHVLNCSSQKVYQLIRNGELKGAFKDASRGRAWKVPDSGIYLYEDVQGRKYEEIISASIQQPQVRNNDSSKAIPTA